LVIKGEVDVPAMVPLGNYNSPPVLHGEVSNELSSTPTFTPTKKWEQKNYKPDPFVPFGKRDPIPFPNVLLDFFGKISENVQNFQKKQDKQSNIKNEL
jgi:hypothetical protein